MGCGPMGYSIESKTFLPEHNIEDEFAEMCANLANHQLATGDNRPRLVFGNGEEVELPPDIMEILGNVAAAMHNGRAITVAPTNTVLSTQEAADLLGISRPTLVRLLEEGAIPFMKPRRHRRVQLVDLLEYQERQRQRANQALSDIISDAHAFGDYDLDLHAVKESLREARHGA